MTVEEVSKKSNELRAEIERLVNEFEKTTKCSVASLDLDRACTADHPYGHAFVRLEVRLP